MASISSLFGYILNFIYSIVQNYGLAIIIFSVLLKLILLPISIKQQKTMKKTSKIQGKVKEIQDKYKNDPNKMNQEVRALYKQENMSPFSGCLSSIVQIILLLAMFGLVRNPLTYMLKTDQNVVNKVVAYIKLENENINTSYPQISVLKYVSKNYEKEINVYRVEEKLEEREKEKNGKEKPEKVAKEAAVQLSLSRSIVENNAADLSVEDEQNAEEQEVINLKDLYINMNFAGLDLSNVPKDNWKEDLTVLIIPVLYVITSIVSMKLTTKMTNNMNSNKDKKVIEIEKDGNVKKETNPEEMTAQMGKSMTWFIPIMSISISLIAPLGLALYWLVNNVLMVTERIVIDKVLKSEEEKQNG